MCDVVPTEFTEFTEFVCDVVPTEFTEFTEFGCVLLICEYQCHLWEDIFRWTVLCVLRVLWENILRSKVLWEVAQKL